MPIVNWKTKGRIHGIVNLSVILCLLVIAGSLLWKLIPYWWLWLMSVPFWSLAILFAAHRSVPLVTNRLIEAIFITKWEPVKAVPFQLRKPWKVIKNGDDLEKELYKKLESGHPLKSLQVKAMAARIDCDDVLFYTSNTAEPIVIADLTRSGKREKISRWPSTRTFTSWDVWRKKEYNNDVAEYTSINGMPGNPLTEGTTMGGLEEARQLFKGAGLTFPEIPPKLAKKLKKHGEWLFSTHSLEVPPYNLDYYVQECEGTREEEYTVISHSGHGANSYAIQYYLVYGPLRMFLHLGWGGAYMDANAAESKIRKSFSLADKIVSVVTTQGKLADTDNLTIVTSDFYGSYWFSTGRTQEERNKQHKRPEEVLAEVLSWLKDLPAYNS